MVNDAWSIAATAGKIKNTLFLSNTTDYGYKTSAFYTQFTNCAFGQLTFQAGMVACQFGATTSEVVNSVTKDLHIAAGATKCINAGTNTGAPTVDLENATRPYNAGTVDIGA